MAQLPDAVLFTCNLNKVRSPMAAALLRHRLAGRIYVDSCGLEAAEAADPFTVSVMEELGMNLSAHVPKTFESLDVGAFDVVISLTRVAHSRALERARRHAVAVEYWPTGDPTTEEGTRDQRMQFYRRVRDDLDHRIQERFAVGA